MRNTWGVRASTCSCPQASPPDPWTISGPRRKVTWHTEALVDLVERTAPAELVEEIDPAALEDADLLDVIRETRPDLLRRSVRKAFIKKLDEALSDDGHLTDHSTGEVVKVADVDHTPVTGAFTFTPGDRAEEAVLEAWHRGELAGVASPLVPQIERTPEPAPTDEPTGTLPPGGQS
ncbi:hypothetical protein [Nocardiopsis sp. YSL2]|uniref:hypothetical protein n=1 Tax=Nocardiopsis sp. YSL2 TaxID=2939492 RepID=UPI0026F43A71|nr:hypothetical protein [Nocardiopsis sp. YSL2]